MGVKYRHIFLCFYMQVYKRFYKKSSIHLCYFGIKKVLHYSFLYAKLYSVGQARTLTERNIAMTLADTINQTRTNIKTIREYLNNLEYNNEESAVTVMESVNRPLDDVRNAIEFINDYNGVTKELVKVLKNYYNDK